MDYNFFFYEDKAYMVLCRYLLTLNSFGLCEDTYIASYLLGVAKKHYTEG